MGSSSVQAALPGPEKTLEFIENRGQWPAPVRYAASLPAGRLFLRPTGFTYSLFSPEDLGSHGHDQAGAPHAPKAELRGHAYTVTFEGGNAAPTLTGTEATTEQRSYFRGPDPRQWATGVRGFRQVQYQGVYAKTDVQLYENAAGHLEYDFVVAPGGRPAAIRLRYQGANTLRLEEGNLMVGTSVGTVTELAPRAWQYVNGKAVTVPCSFELRGQTVSFLFPQGYRKDLALTIDPTVVFSSYTGSTADNWGNTATYDEEGHLYSAGVVFAPGYPVSAGAFSTSFSGVIDVGIIKYDTQANGPAARLYATYLGGENTETPHSLVVNAQGELLIFGSTSSRQFPTTTGAVSRTLQPGQAYQVFNSYSYLNGADLFVAKLSANGSTLLASTLLGGSGWDGLNVDTGNSAGNFLARNYGDTFRGDIITDAEGNVYVASCTSSNNFPVKNGLKRAYGGGTLDGLVLKLSPKLDQLYWASYLGGNGADAAYSIKLASDGSVYVAGGTTGSNFPGTTGALQAGSAGNTDGFVAHISADGSSLLQATYRGTDQYDQVYFLQLDAADNVYVLGQSFGNFPITAGLYDNRKRRGGQFIQKLSPQLNSLTYSTVFGSGRGGTDLSLTAFLVDDCERIYACGWGGNINNGYTGGSTTDLPTSSNAVQPSTDGSDFYVVQFGAGARAIEYATFFGEQGGSGEHVDGGTSRFDKRGVVYHAVCGGCRGSSRFPVPPGANTYSRVNNSSNCNNAAFKIDFELRIANAGRPQAVCADAGPIRLGGSPSGGVWAGPGISQQADGSYIFTPSAALVGEQALRYTAQSTGTCFTNSNLRMTVRPVVPVDFSLPAQRCTNEDLVPLTATPAGGTWSGPGVRGSQFDPAAAGPGTHTITYTLPADQCGQASRQIVVLPPPVVEAGRDTALCSFQNTPYQLQGATPAGGTWSGTGVTPEGWFTPPVAADSAQRLRLTYTYQAPNGCPDSDVRQVVMAPLNTNVQPLPVLECVSYPGKTGLAPFSIRFVSPAQYASQYDWDFGDGTPHGTTASVEHIYERAGTYTVAMTAAYNSTCQVQTRYLQIEVADPLVPNIITPNNGDNLNQVFIQHYTCLPAALKVFSRWGQEVYSSADYRNDWDGGKLPGGVYYFLLRDTEGRQYKGWLDIHR
ncbi:DUF7948 domain-containing protein [Hymenobacter guriensis]|uniref:Gliding motility-associated C-terminal domain-containing protein n=1 Tax=Hymenobacter guriensis TaxID=2793065 RepID=A0ABS0L0Q0_9BACT|nr:gliding motility-associated C-terminal domain-containing protein [Hymenobacter guriensis]MBG8553004.1 gliding motility-associated C-terminal domain-containing protein [Hymenobacter guriensis]